MEEEYYENGCKAILTIIIMTIVFAEINVEYVSTW